jgi:hypothetical protein
MGTDGTEWYSSSPNEKAAFGLYDDVVTLGADKSLSITRAQGVLFL